MSKADKNLFWQFSLDFYGCPAVADLCLQLQDDHQRQVNIVLWCLWLGQQGKALDKSSLACALEQLQDWQLEVVQPLRHARKALKHHALSNPVIYRQAKQLELELEQQEQGLLFDLSYSLVDYTKRPKLTLAEENLRLYLVADESEQWLLAERLLLILEQGG